MNRTIERKIIAGFVLTFLCIATQAISGHRYALRSMELDRRISQAQDARAKLSQAPRTAPEAAATQAQAIARLMRENESLDARADALMGILASVELLLLGVGCFGAWGFLRRRQREYQRLEAAEARVQELSTLQGAILDSANLSIISADANGLIRTMNATAERWLGYAAADFIGKRDPGIFHDPQEVVRRAEALSHELGREIAPGFEVFVAKARETGCDEQEWTYVRKDGSRFPILLGVTALRDSRGEEVGFLGIARDITERKSAQEERETLAAIVENAQEFIATADLKGRLKFINPAGRRMIGMDETAEPGGLTIADISTEASLRATREQAFPTAEAQGFWHGEGQLRNLSTGEIIETLKSTMMIRHPQTGEPFCMASTQRDVTAFRQAQRALLESAALQQLIFDEAAVGMKLLTPDGTILRANRSFCDMIGYAEEEVVGKNYQEFTFPEDMGRSREVFLRLLAGEIAEASMEKRCLHKDGSLIYVLLKKSLLRDSEGRPQSISAQVINITERKLAEDALRRSQEALEEAQRVAQIGNWEFDAATGKITWSKELFHLMGCDPAQGEPAYETAIQLYHPADAAHLDAVFTRALREGVPYALDLRGAAAEGEAPRWFHAVGNPVFDEAGNVVRLAGILMDITERKRAEEALRETSDRLIEAQRVARVGTWEFDVASGKSVWSEEMCRVFGCDPATAKTDYQTLLSLFQPEDAARLSAAVELAVTQGVPYALDFRLAAGPDEPGSAARWIHGVGRPVFDSEGKVTRLVGTGMDITERKRAEDLLREQTEVLTNVLTAIPNSVFWKDRQGHYLGCNVNFARDAGVPVSEVIGKTDYEMPWGKTEAAAYVAHDRAVMAQGTPLINLEETQLTSGGETTVLLTSKVPMRDRKGQVTGILGIYADITAHKRTEVALRETSERLRLATVAGDMGVFDYDLVTQALVWDDQMMRMFAFTPETFPGAYEAWSERLHPDDKAQAVAALEAAIASETKFVSAFRIVRPDGSVRYIEAEGILARDENGKPRRMIGQNKDVTARRETEMRMERLNRQNALLLESIGEGLYGIDLEGRATFVNPAAAAMLGYTVEEMRGWKMHDLLHYAREDSRPYPVAECPICNALQSGEVARVSDEVFWRKDGSCFPVEYFSTPIREEGRIVGMVVSFQDVTERRQRLRQIEEANRLLEQNMLVVSEQAVELEYQKQEMEYANVRLEALATTDGLTEIKNHRAFQQALIEEFARAERRGDSLSLLLMDVDKFKSFNDTFGHPAGDKTLKAVADTLQKTARTGDFVARYGGEEFVVILPNAGAEGAMAAAERFRAAIEAYGWEERQVTVSIGVATLRPGADTPPLLIDCADKALYQAKQRGRNRAIHAQEMWLESGAQDASKSIRDALKEVLAAQNEESLFDIDYIHNTMFAAYDATVESWARIVEMKDRETEGHSERVTGWMDMLAQYVGMNADEAHYAHWGALLHDIGKVGVPDAILQKPGPLTEDEWVVMRRHPDIAREMLKGIAFLSPALEIPCCHHEKWDGTGYPLGLKGEAIPFAARLFAIIDVYDALTSDRPYRKGWPEPEARAHLLEQSGTHFDPRAVTAFVAMLSARDGCLRKAA